jgi:hypothetical protein
VNAVDDLAEVSSNSSYIGPIYTRKEVRNSLVCMTIKLPAVSDINLGVWKRGSDSLTLGISYMNKGSKKQKLINPAT